MDAIILAAGLGTRLRPHTLTTPKPLLTVKGRPILDWTLGALPRAVDRVIVVVNYLAEQIEAYLKQQKHFREWTTVRQEVPRGTGDALRSCRHAVRSDRFLVLNGDDLFGAKDLEALAARSAGLLVHQVNEPEKFGIVFTNPDGTLRKLEEKPKLPPPQLANVGVYLFPRRALDIDLPLSPRGEYEITDAVSAIAATEPFYVVPASFWLPIGNIEAWQAAEKADLSVVQSR
jgi:bifunctional UDP-N-acetylglucosamine pyrophosphorylase/glucosamine-1-phosphate N-acetyltransferase